MGFIFSLLSQHLFCPVLLSAFSLSPELITYVLLIFRVEFVGSLSTVYSKSPPVNFWLRWLSDKWRVVLLGVIISLSGIASTVRTRWQILNEIESRSDISFLHFSYVLLASVERSLFDEVVFRPWVKYRLCEILVSEKNRHGRF